MTPPVRFVYALYDEETTIGPESPTWVHPLPVTRDSFINTHKRPHPTGSFTYGDYFSAARNFLEKSPFLFPNLKSPGRQISARRPEPVEMISICLKKHGELYHPAKIEVIRGGRKNTYVLNVAVSNTGKKRVRGEYQIMGRLNRTISPSHIPRTYDFGKSTSGSGQAVFMFLGEWFEGFHEFHISCHCSKNPRAIRLWGAERSPFFLSTKQAHALYRQATRVLLHYYDLETSHQIYPWHHAAGDFVAKVKGDIVVVKLITTRGYSPLLRAFDHGDQVQQVLEGLLVFMLSVSIRMRLDRMDGVGEMAWSGGFAVNAVVDGFLKGLEQKPRPRTFPAPPADCFKAYLSGYQESDLYDLFQSILEQNPPQISETRLAKKHLTPHTQAFFHALTSHL